MTRIYTLTPIDGGPPVELTQAEFDRFFDNRDPGSWQAATAVYREIAIDAGGCAPPVIARARADNGMFDGGPVPPEAIEGRP